MRKLHVRLSRKGSPLPWLNTDWHSHVVPHLNGLFANLFALALGLMPTVIAASAQITPSAFREVHDANVSAADMPQARADEVRYCNGTVLAAAAYQHQVEDSIDLGIGF